MLFSRATLSEANLSGAVTGKKELQLEAVRWSNCWTPLIRTLTMQATYKTCRAPWALLAGRLIPGAVQLS